MMKSEIYMDKKEEEERRKVYSLLPPLSCKSPYNS
jgi:hypothetical protein